MANEGQISSLERLTKLRDSGALTPEQFEQEKAKVLAAPDQSVPFYRRLWFVVTLTCLILTFPIALLILLTGDVYKRANGEAPEPISTKARHIYAGVLVLWLVAAGIRAFLVHGETASNQVEPAQTASRAPSNATAAASAPTKPVDAPATTQEAYGPPACTDPALHAVVMQGIQLAFDKAAEPLPHEMGDAVASYAEFNDEKADLARRSIVANSNGEIRQEETRICSSSEPALRGIALAIVVWHNHKLGGIVMNTGLPPITFGDL